tara:strand:- start:1307 stop:1717 length:411 start_codon:yes stop_codon:yes gene_type:complete
MSTKKKIERHSFVDENGQRWLQCKYCYNYQKVEDGVVASTCGTCAVKVDLIKFPNTAIKIKKPKTGRPAGWHFMNEFVDKDGNVFHKGKEQPDLKGTLEPTVVKPRKKKKKLSADEKLFKKAADWKKRLKARRGKK